MAANFGFDYLAGCNYLPAILAAHPKGRCAGIFLTTFGNAKQTLRQMAASGLFNEITVHLAPFDYSHKYPIKQNKEILRSSCFFLDKLQLKFPNTKFYASPFCEHNHPRSVYEPLLDRLKKIAPNLTFVNSIWLGEPIPGVITEIHLTNARPHPAPRGPLFVSLDGFGGDKNDPRRCDSTDADLQKLIARYPNALQFRGWNFRANGKFGHLDPAPIGARDHWPDANYLRGHHAQLKDRAGSISWPDTALYKPFADDHGNAEPTKDNKAMCILPLKAAFVDVFDSKGKRIDRMRRVTPDFVGKPAGARYYSEKFAYEIGNAAERNTGSRLIRIANMPLTDADLRSGLFR